MSARNGTDSHRRRIVSVYGSTHPATTTRRADGQLPGRVGVQSRNGILRADPRRATATATPTADMPAGNGLEPSRRTVRGHRITTTATATATTATTATGRWPVSR